MQLQISDALTQVACTCMLLLHPVPTCTNAGLDLLQLVMEVFSLEYYICSTVILMWCIYRYMYAYCILHCMMWQEYIVVCGDSSFCRAASIKQRSYIARLVIVAYSRFDDISLSLRYIYI